MRMIWFCFAICLLGFPVVKCDETSDDLTDYDETEEPTVITDDVHTPGPETNIEPSPEDPASNEVPSVAPVEPSVAPVEPSVVPGEPSVAPGEASGAHEFLQLLNEARQAAGLKTLVWDDELAKRAQDMANTCVKVREKYNFNGILTYVNKPEKDYSPKKVVKNWLNKAKNAVNGDTSACCSQESTTCCRYTKAVSPNFKSVGCGYKFCESLKFGSKFYPNRQAVVCMFAE